MKNDDPIVHVAIVLDASDSMKRLKSKVIEQADKQIRDLKNRSEELGLETRVSVYIFSGRRQIFCPIFDRDVFRLGSIADVYSTMSMTALIDATIKSQQDLAATAQMYGRHHFLTFVWTDGVENDSKNASDVLSGILRAQGENWSIAAFVPDTGGKSALVAMGFAPANVQIWDVSAAGLEKAAASSTRAADHYMTTVSKGGKVDKTNVFGTGVDKVNTATVTSQLIPLTTGSYEVHDVLMDTRIDDFVRSKRREFFVGKGYYSFTKTETIQKGKRLIVVEKATGIAYGGASVRTLLGLPDDVDVRVRPDANPDYLICVQSTANNRKLLAGTKLVWTF